MQGSYEFKAEIELLSRVHHKNLVSLIGFCFERGEQMLVYEYVPNGTLKDVISGTYIHHTHQLKGSVWVCFYSLIELDAFSCTLWEIFNFSGYLFPTSQFSYLNPKYPTQAFFILL